MGEGAVRMKEGALTLAAMPTEAAEGRSQEEKPSVTGTQ